MSSTDGGLPERDADLSLPPLKKYKRWKEDDTAPIPTRTLQRWESNTPNNSSLNDNCSGCTSTSILIADHVTETGDDNSRSNECDSDFSSSDSSTDSDTEDFSDMHDSDDDTDNSDVVMNEDNHDTDSNLDENVEDTCHDSDLSEEKSSILQYLYENSTISTDESVSMRKTSMKHKIYFRLLSKKLRLYMEIES
ncbi:unnamed protein product [Arctia plantaginis]|uniref:Uncharacterized protein n=1 Tax=Arctia plantaginis TaxID=874455 RepID=A0A8S0ZTG5_ARCPL|nr:unnamed protein product [Arctia plantaginis]